MGPRFFKRGEHPLGNRTQDGKRGFNGATLLQAWRALLRGRLQARGQGASMGPRFFKRGETSSATTRK